MSAPEEVREDCPLCGAQPLDYDTLMGGGEVLRMYWCAECGWSLTVEFPQRAGA